MQNAEDRIRVQDMLNRDLSMEKIARIIGVSSDQLTAQIEEWDRTHPKPPKLIPKIVTQAKTREKVRGRQNPVLSNPLKQVGDLLNNGMTLREAANKLGVTYACVSHYAKRLGIVSPVHEQRAERLKVIAELLDAGMSQAAIARNLGVSPDTVTKKVRELGRSGEKKRTTKTRRQQIQEFMQQGLRPCEMLQLMEISTAALNRYLRDLRKLKCDDS